MSLTPVESSNIAAVGQSAPNLEDNTATLSIQFKSGGTYDYANVPLEIIDDFINAESIGKAFYSAIRNQYTGVKREEAE